MGRLAKNPHLHNAKSVATTVTVPHGSTSAQPSFSDVGQIRFNTDDNRLEYWIQSSISTTPGVGSWVGIPGSGRATIVKSTFSGDGVNTDFTLSTSVADDNDILVFVGGVFQNPGVAFTVSGTTLQFSSIPPNGETIIVLDGYNSTEVVPE